MPRFSFSRSMAQVVTTVALLALFCPRAGAAQGVGPTLAGAGAGLLAGGAVSAAAVVVASRADAWLWDWSDAHGWPLIPVAAGVVAGGLQGALASDRLAASVGFGVLGGLTGAAAGWLAGELAGDRDADRWAGLTVGLGAGAALGWLAGGIFGGGHTDVAHEPIPVFEVTLPVGGGGR